MPHRVIFSAKMLDSSSCLYGRLEYALIRHADIITSAENERTRSGHS